MAGVLTRGANVCASQNMPDEACMQTNTVKSLRSVKSLHYITLHSTGISSSFKIKYAANNKLLPPQIPESHPGLRTPSLRSTPCSCPCVCT